MNIDTKQWDEFLDGKAWSYNIVPSIVSNLKKALSDRDAKAFNSARISLAHQGITLNNKGELCYFMDEVLGGLI